MVAGDHDNRDLMFPQPDELTDQVQARVVIAPIAVIQVAGNEHEIDASLDGKVDQPRESPSCRSSYLVDGCVLVSLQALEWAIEMNVRRVQKGYCHGEKPGRSTTHSSRQHRAVSGLGWTIRFYST